MKLRVPLFNAINKFVWVDEKATEGAVVGSNLLWPDGSTVKESDIRNSAAVASSTGLTTTDDLNEGGYHLYFTNRRAQDAVGGILADSANVSLSYAGGTSITADLIDQADSGVGAALVKITRDSKGRVSGTSAATTGDLAEGSNLYFTDARVLATTLTGLSTADASAVTATDSVLVGIGKLQAQVNTNATAIAGKEPAIAAGTTAQYWRGDKTWRDFATDVRAAVLTGLSTATSAVIAATDTVLGALGKLQSQITDNLLPQGYIDGLKMVWVSGTALTVTTGAAYIPGLGKVLRVTSDIAKTGLSLTASTWYHVYIYSNAGTPDVEISTTAPATAYNGTARTKTGDTSRRYVGSVLVDASGSLYPFLGSNGRVVYTSGNSSGIFSILGGGAATTSTSLSLSAVVPITATMAALRLANNSTTSNFSVQIGVGSDKFLSIATVPAAPGPPVTADCPISGQAMAYICGGSGGSAGIGLIGYIYER